MLSCKRLVQFGGAGSASDDVDGSFRVNIALVRLALVHWPRPFVIMLVPVDEKVNPVLEKDVFHPVLVSAIALLYADLDCRRWSVAIAVARAVD